MIAFSMEEHKVVDDFKWLNYEHNYLEKLRQKFRLNSLINNQMDDLQIVEVVMKWVSGLWEHNGENEPQHSDPLFVLEEVSNGKQYRCVEYAIVLNGCLNALVLYSRILSLKTKDCETREFGAGHIVVEVYIPKLEKWIMADPQFNVVPYINKTPINAVEFALNKNQSVQIKPSLKNDFSYLNWIRPYLYYFTVNFDNRVNDNRSYKEKKQLMLGPINA
ncbi:hypothetical protein M4D55_15725 [Metabacillus idriensis]|uniref:transglutaminase domain-containing protein n=1 Tax=Metabacillus idriensis TaxID=324768 RepID=UPI0020412368|nr:hypothetical protein [Metabacillus idriensis]MCM3597224.1 hypothetical protein [Metabacillus idriensis]